MPRKPESELSTFARISESVYFFDPKTPTSNSSLTNSLPQRDPDTIVLFSWMGAGAGAISKYITGYKGLFPSTRIILIRTEMGEYLFHSDAQQRSKLFAVVTALKMDRNANVMVVSFSNGGALKLSRLAEAYKQSTGSRLPIDALVLDSGPGKTSLKESVEGMRFGLPQALYYPGMIVLYGFVAVMMCYFIVLGKDSLIERAGKILNDSELMDRGFKRLYIYSKEDKIVRWRDVEEHAADAEKKGWKVKTEMFKGSQHSAHVRVDGERYWAAVKKVWNERGMYIGS